VNLFQDEAPIEKHKKWQYLGNISGPGRLVLPFRGSGESLEKRQKMATLWQHLFCLFGDFRTFGTKGVVDNQLFMENSCRKY
jgi:hypothetical protein